MRRVVVTGMGIVSCLGNNISEVLQSLKAGKSGIRFNQSYADVGMRSQVSGSIDLDTAELIDRKLHRFMGEASAYAYISMEEALRDAKLSLDEISDERVGLVVGSGGGSPEDQLESTDVLREKGIRRVGPYRIPRTMSSSVSACLATPFKIRGVNYSISSACATSAHCIGNAAELIQMGKQDIVFAGGGESEHWSMSHMFDAMGALSSGFNETPDKASRAFDAGRDGFVISSGGGIVVMEEMEHALKRGATIYAELTGYAATSDGYDMVAPSGEGGARAMRMAQAGFGGSAAGSAGASAKGSAGEPSGAAREAAKGGSTGGSKGEAMGKPVDYINTHGTSTPTGDVSELRAIQEVFGDTIPAINSTKSLSGHSLGAAGVHEAIYSLLMMVNDFIAESVNIENLDPAAAGLPIVRQRQDNVQLNRIMSNSFGFGGTNACLVFDRFR